MNPRIRNAMIIVGILLLAVAVVLLLFFRPKAAAPVEEPAAEQPATNTGLTSSPSVPTQTFPVNPLVPTVTTPPAPDERLAARQSAEIFAERYGSYSNQGDFQNLKDLLPSMTASFRAKTEALIEANAGQVPPADYQGVTSVKFSSTLGDFDSDAGTATVIVTLQQTKTSATSTSVVYTTLTVSLKKENGEWKIDVAVWQIP